MKKTYLLALSLVCGLGGNGLAQEAAKPLKAYIVSDAHFDTQWNWDVQTSINEYVKNTLERNLSLLERYPDYLFNFEGAIKYAWMKEYYPDMYEKMKNYIREGRWNVCGSSWDANDVLISSSESVIRNILLGQTFYREEFGTESTDIFLPDCFGFGWTLPSLAAHCGLIGFSSQKLGWRNHPFYGNEKIPFSIGLWQGIDGKRLMFAHGYDYTTRWPDEDLSANTRLKELAEASPLGTVYHYYGTGDIGGSPTQESVRAVEKGLKGQGPVEIINATSDRLYKDYLPYENHPELPVFDGELTMDVHGTGCYTSQAAMKLYNRQNEQLGDAAERASVAAEWLGRTDYPGRELTEAWRRFIYHQFHDDLTGTSIPRAYEFSWNDELLSLKQFSSILTHGVSGVSEILDTRTKGTPVVLYNANAFDTDDLAEIHIPLPATDKHYCYEVYDAEGHKVKSQLIGERQGQAVLLTEARVPANGYAVCDVRISSAKRKQNHPASSLDGNRVENSIYRITFDTNGDIVSLVDKRHGKEIVKEGKAIRLALFTDNPSHSWPAWEILKGTLDRTPQSITEDVKISLTEDGALRKTVCIEKRHGQSVFRQYVRLYEGSRAGRIDFYNEVDWQTENALLKAEFPLNVENEKATYDLGLGSIQRGNNVQTAYEVYAHQWADLTADNGSYGVSILNDCKYGWDKPDNHTLRLTLLHTPSVGGSFTYQAQQDLGHHVFTYSLTGHAGTLDKASTCMQAATLNQPLKAFTVTKHKGTLGKTFSFLRSDNDKVLVKALKKAETSDEYVVRLYETEGKSAQKATLTFAGDIESACEADGTEKRIGDAAFRNNTLTVEIPPYSLKTFKVRLKKVYPETKAQYAFLPLDYDRKCISWNGFGHEADFESGYSYAAELLPDSALVSNGIPFRLGEKEVKNGMTCKGDTLRLPSGKPYNRLYLLAASTDADHTVTFSVGDRETQAFIPYYSGFIGQWGHTGHTEGYLKPVEVAYVGTHRHTDKGNEAYEFTYLFKIGLDVPEGVQSIRLPDNEKVVLFAATLVEEDTPAARPACPLFRTALAESATADTAPKNLLKGARVIGCSGEVNASEKAACAIDGDLSTKWCDTESAPNYVDFDLGSPQQMKGWKVVSAGHENHDYITRSCFLQGRNAPDEKWHTIDIMDDNSRNVFTHTFPTVSYRYLRLLVTRPTKVQTRGAARIYELEVY